MGRLHVVTFGRDTDMCQDVTQKDTLVDHGPARCRTPVEPDRLFDHVHLLTAVTATTDTDGELCDGEDGFARQLVHGKFDRVVDEGSLDAEFVCIPIKFWDGTVVPDDLQVPRCDEGVFRIVLRQFLKDRFSVERVLSGQPYHPPVTGDPVVRRLLVAGVALVLHEVTIVSDFVRICHVDGVTGTAFIAGVLPRRHRHLYVWSVDILTTDRPFRQIGGRYRCSSCCTSRSDVGACVTSFAHFFSCWSIGRLVDCWLETNRNL
mmetsp:Transcript_2098/g.4859  ORF Transcript_2098/g.4859 Transcript_2098/m.4859 type:complete len:262 (-) Transcript_2098:409-1194(-)